MISERVMSVLGANAPGHEIYSIDECFLDLDRLAVADLTEWCRDLRQTTLQWTGIPVSVGVGPTKTLAKLANRLAKKSAKAGGVLDLVHHPNWIDAALRKTPIGDVWGVGRRWSAMLEERGIRAQPTTSPTLRTAGCASEWVSSAFEPSTSCAASSATRWKISRRRNRRPVVLAPSARPSSTRARSMMR